MKGVGWTKQTNRAARLCSEQRQAWKGSVGLQRGFWNGRCWKTNNCAAPLQHCSVTYRLDWSTEEHPSPVGHGMEGLPDQLNAPALTQAEERCHLHNPWVVQNCSPTKEVVFIQNLLSTSGPNAAKFV